MKKLSILLILIITIFLFCTGAEAANYAYAASLEGDISLHLSPSEDSIVITKIPACSKLEIVKTERTWGLVIFKHKAGWINLSFTRDSYSKAAEATGNDMATSVQVDSKSGQAILYSVPSDDASLGSTEKYTVPNQTVLEVTRQVSSGWGLVSMHGKYAWVKMDEVKSYDTQNDSDKYGIYYVYTLSEKGEGVNLYSDKNGKTLSAVIPDCIKLTVRETHEQYAYVSYNGMNGYIDLKYTTQSLSNAQSNAGEKVNSEYIVTPLGEETTVSVYSVPSEKEEDGPSIVGTVEKDESVYVLRSTLSGWSLINCDGQLGWLPPQTVAVAEMTGTYNNIEVYDTKKISFVATVQGRGIEVFSETGSSKGHSFIPETSKIEILAEDGDFKYVYSEFASGWTKIVPTFETYEEALSQYPDEKKKFYRIKGEARFMTMPTWNENSGSEEIGIIPDGKYIETIRTVTTGKAKWVLIEYDGVLGWVHKSQLTREGFAIAIALAIGALLALVGLIAALISYIIKKKKSKKSEKEVEDDEKSIHDEDSGDREESPTLSGE